MAEPVLYGEEVAQLAGARVCVLGDLMLDHFVYGRAERISPEAPVPVVAIEHESTMLGGAGNVARNLIALGAQVSFVSVVGGDDTGKTLMRMLGQEPLIEPYIQVDPPRITPRKTRYISGNQHLLRADQESIAPLLPETETQVLRVLDDVLERCTVLVVSDYAKGMIRPAFFRKVAEKARQRRVPVLVDPKSRDYSVYRGASLITPNQAEARAVLPAATVIDEETLAQAADIIMRQSGSDAVLITRGREGMEYFARNETPVRLRARAREVYDVSGAGDTVIATLAAAWAAGLPRVKAAALANLAAGLVVGKVGTATVTHDELRHAIHTDTLQAGEAKIVSLMRLQEQVALWRRRGLKIGFTNGCFDLLHPGHVTLLARARQQCDRLIVGLNSDASITRLKGEGRPVQPETARALVLASLASVDRLIVFTEDTPLALIEALRPDVLFKGADYTVDQVVGNEVVRSYGGEVRLIPLVEGNSTSNIIERIGYGQ